MTGYVRKDTTNNIADGNVINAADLDSEFDGVQDAFNASTGHKHDGTAGEGATINALGPTQDVTVSSTLLAPKTTNTVDIGSSALKFKDLFLAGNASVGGTLAVTGATTLSAALTYGGVTLSNAVTGTGNMVLSTSPTLVTPILGTPTSATLTNATGLPISTGVSGLGTGVATFLATPSSANLAAALTDETGSGANVFATSPTLVTPILGTPTSATLTNATGLPLTTGVTGTLPTANGGTNLTSFTSGGVVYASSTSVLATGSALTFDGSVINLASTTNGVIARFKTSQTYGQVVADNTGATGGGLFIANQNGVASSYFGVDGAILGTTSTDTGIYNNIASSSIKFYNDGSATPKLTLTPSVLFTGSGINVGIGTSSPATKLDVVGSASFSGNLGVGDFAASSAVGLNVRFIGNLTSIDIVGISNSISAPASASNSTIGVYSSLRATATSGSRGFLSSFYAESPSMGATSTASTIRGIYVNNQGNAAINNAYGIYIEAPTGSPTLNQGLYNGGSSRLDGNVGLNTTPATSGTGITFPATQSASSNANTLDDYEEGVWSASGITAVNCTGVSFSEGRYTKIGNIVHIQGKFSLTVTTANTLTYVVMASPLTPLFSTSGSVMDNSSLVSGTLQITDAGNTYAFFAASASLPAGATLFYVNAQYQV